MEIIFAFITAIAFGFDNYFIKKGLIESPYPMVASFITLTINFIFFLILSLIFIPTSLLKLKLVYLFIIAGILAPGFARYFSYKGLETLGMSITIPIVNAETLFSVVLSLIFLKEPFNILIAVGVLSAVAGIILLGYETGKKNKENISKKTLYRYLSYPITASIFYGVSVFLRKLGLNITNSPIIGATFTSGTSWCIIAILLVTTSGNAKRLYRIKKQSYVYFIMGGIATSIAWVSIFNALNIGRIVIVMPIANSYSLLTLFLSYILLHEVELINSKIVMATILIVVGIILLYLVD